MDNINSKSPANSDHQVDATKVCSYQQGESTKNCSFPRIGARGNNSVATKRYLVEIDFPLHIISPYYILLLTFSFRNDYAYHYLIVIEHIICGSYLKNEMCYRYNIEDWGDEP